MKSSRKRGDWVWRFTLFLLVSLAILVGVGFYLNGWDLFLSKTDDKRMDFVGSVLGTSVAIASALVAIILAKVALQYAENEAEREFKNTIAERIQNTRNIVYQIVNAYKQLDFVAYDVTTNVHMSMPREEREREFKRVYNPLKKFAQSLEALEQDYFTNQTYKHSFDTMNDFYKEHSELPTNLVVDPRQITEIAVQLQHKYANEYTLGSNHQFILLHREQIESRLGKLSDEDKKNIVVALFMGYNTAPLEDELNIKLVGAITFLDILINLPTVDNIKAMSEKIDSDYWKSDREKASKIIDALAGNEVSLIDKEKLKRARAKLIKDFDDFLIFQKMTIEDKKTLEDINERIQHILTDNKVNMALTENKLDKVFIELDKVKDEVKEELEKANKKKVENEVFFDQRPIYFDRLEQIPKKLDELMRNLMIEFSKQ